MKILILNGPNLNMLGKREPHIYGKLSLSDIEETIKNHAKSLGVEVEFFQSNYEGAIVEKIHQAFGNADGIIINPGAYTHTSIAIRDAFLSVNIPFVEVHLSNVFSRESFRHKSYLSDIAQGVVSGLGQYSYICALNFLINFQNS
ncbi:MAG: type II 3-dehydroquinate dehydratase [Desulfurella sp.]|jgi:3-dehydroquinate dehydratase-2|uniref:type II 3-dehydroquinate dehydratase n=1 Tax=Desulfurella TaxID=33001 RepID=UPI0003E0ACEB|nr:MULTISPECIES: type II 3-dehydroquinate dehydratase [Desulfurella]AHF97441.1 3-dehydroquinate dehydratase [Desulfurella acetivorans A63]PMP65347.1 MAG: type II 3-dehydroquinate dehydratase [Desulfurella multipotens]PMP92112.1 MAG: type II 3-dehydroquinate dehydratase [Desulfurella sp.]HEX13889.1 type II 3-dehydroquinate dehydratase [Desulfurella acetivorans]